MNCNGMSNYYISRKLRSMELIHGTTQNKTLASLVLITICEFSSIAIQYPP